MPPTIEEGKTIDRSEQMWKVLKSHIMRERARKKQEREQEVEEERLRKEREAREQQDVMTLGETREQISQLEAKLQKLKEEKHQLFLQLKKVLNEDDNRRRQLVKENSDVLALQPAFVHQQLYISPNVGRAPVPLQQQQQQQQAGFKPTIKRPRSPSPQPSVTVSSYHQGYGYKPPVAPAQPYQNSPQKDENRRHEFVRAVLWNKTSSQYPPNQAFYAHPSQEIPIYYPPLSTLSSREQARNVYEPQPPPTRSQNYHLEQKIPDHYALRAPVAAPHGHVMHSGPIALSPAQPPSKTGSITAGYPVRTQQQYQQSSPVSMHQQQQYSAQSRPLYQSSGAPMNYPPRE